MPYPKADPMIPVATAIASNNNATPGVKASRYEESPGPKHDYDSGRFYCSNCHAVSVCISLSFGT